MPKNQNIERLRVIAAICIDMARGLTVAGAGTARVEDTIHYIGASCDVPVESQVTPTSIVISVGEERPVIRICRVHSRTIDMDKLAALNDISRALCAHKLTIHEAKLRIAKILARKPLYSRTAIYWGQAFCCAGFAVILDGGIHEIPPSFFEGFVAYYCMVKTSQMPMFLGSFITAMVTTSMAITIHKFFPIIQLEPVILAGVVPLLPGLSLANAVADLMAGELTAGIARTVEALLCAAALAMGAIIALNINNMI